MIKAGVSPYVAKNEMWKNPPKTLQRIAEIGVRYLEVCNQDYEYGLGSKDYSITPKEYRKVLDDLGLTAISCAGIIPHDGEAERMFERAKIIGATWYNHNMDFYPTEEILYRNCEWFNKVGKKCKEMGMQFCLHNHAHEFRKFGDTCIFDTILANTDPEYVKFEIDLYWILRSGLDPVDFIRKLGDRAANGFHIKEYPKNRDDKILFAPNGERINSLDDYFKVWDNDDSIELGEGIVDVQAIIDVMDELGHTEYLLSEQDETKLDEIESVRRSYNNLISYKGIEG